MKLKAFVNLLYIALIIFVSGCKEDPAPTLWETFEGGNGEQPVINSISPSDSAYAGVDIITIYGDNFSSGLANDSNFVSFNGTKGEILFASPTELQVKVPVLVDDKMTFKDSVVGIKIWSQGASLYSDTFYYKIKAPFTEYAVIDQYNKTVIRGMTVDQYENLYVSVYNDGVKLITPGKEITHYGNKGGETFWNALRWGPSDILHAGTELFWVVFTFSGEGTNPDPSYILPDDKSFMKDFDFDSEKNIWCGTRNGKVVGVNTTSGAFDESEIGDRINCVRYFNGFLYSAGVIDSVQKIFKTEVLSGAVAGATTEFADLTAELGAGVSSVAMVMDNEGSIYLAVDGAEESVIKIYQDGTWEYFYPGIFDYPVYSLAWGNNQYLYASMFMVNDPAQADDDESKILQIDMKDKQAAPCFGRGDM